MYLISIFNETISSYHKTTRLAHEMGEDEFWIYDDDDEDAFEDENWEYFDEAAEAIEEASKPQFLKVLVNFSFQKKCVSLIK